MPINPLNLPDPIKYSSIDWSPLVQLGDAFARYQTKQKVQSALEQATDASGNIDPTKAGTSLAKLGLTDEARPWIALAESRSNRGEAAGLREREFSFRQQEAERAQRNADRAYELQKSLQTEKPAIVWQEDAAGNKTPYLQEPRTGTIRQVPIAGATDQPATNPFSTGKMTEAQGKDALYASRMMNAENVLSDPAVTAAAQSRLERGKAAVPFAGNSLVSEDYQRYDQAQRDFINATLRRESGAAIAQSEFDNANKQYFPQPGDSEAVLRQKAVNRAAAIKGFAAGAGPKWRAPYVFNESGELISTDPGTALRDLGKRRLREQGSPSGAPAAPSPPPSVTTKDQYDLLPSGRNITFIGPDGKTYHKP